MLSANRCICYCPAQNVVDSISFGRLQFCGSLIYGLPKIRGTFLGNPQNKDDSIFGSILRSPYFGKLPYGILGLGTADARPKPHVLLRPDSTRASGFWLLAGAYLLTVASSGMHESPSKL